jgi:selenocysteine lyase/cysteine desulfurase
MTTRTIERRQFLAGLAATPVAIAGCSHVHTVAPAAAVAPPGDLWTWVRAQFALSPDWLHFAGFLLASHPQRVRDAIEAHRRGLDDNPVLYVEPRVTDFAPMQKPAATYMGVSAEQIGLTDSTTMGLATLYHGLPLRPGDEVLTTLHDHYSTHESLRFSTERSGASLRKVALYEDPAQATVGGMAAAIEHALAPATRYVAITWVHSGTGVKTPVREIAEVIARANAARPAQARILLCVDGVHGFGIENVTMADLGCDFFVAGTHKWIFGPRGTGVIWGRPELWPTLRPTIPSFSMASYGAWIQGAPPPAISADVMSPGGFHSFEHRWALGEAFEFHLQIGKDKVAARIHELNRQCKTGLAAMKHVTLHTPMADEVSAGIITFDVAGMKPDDVVKRLLDKHIVASTTPYAQSYARLAPGLLNSPEQVETVLREIRALG